jgi:protein-tyrosine phosphatase
MHCAGLSPEKLQEGVEWALEQRRAGRPVYVFCTHGHGRSAVMLCALLIADGLAGDPQQARHKVLTARPGVRLTHRQCCALERWHAQYGGSSRREGPKGQ